MKKHIINYLVAVLFYSGSAFGLKVITEPNEPDEGPSRDDSSYHENLSDSKNLCGGLACGSESLCAEEFKKINDEAKHSTKATQTLVGYINQCKKRGYFGPFIDDLGDRYNCECQKSDDICEIGKSILSSEVCTDSKEDITFTLYGAKNGRNVSCYCDACSDPIKIKSFCQTKGKWDADNTYQDYGQTCKCTSSEICPFLKPDVCTEDKSATYNPIDGLTCNCSVEKPETMSSGETAAIVVGSIGGLVPFITFILGIIKLIIFVKSKYFTKKLIKLQSELDDLNGRLKESKSESEKKDLEAKISEKKAQLDLIKKSVGKLDEIGNNVRETGNMVGNLQSVISSAGGVVTAATANTTAKKALGDAASILGETKDTLSDMPKGEGTALDQLTSTLKGHVGNLGGNVSHLGQVSSGKGDINAVKSVAGRLQRNMDDVSRVDLGALSGEGVQLVSDQRDLRSLAGNIGKALAAKTPAGVAKELNAVVRKPRAAATESEQVIEAETERVAAAGAVGAKTVERVGGQVKGTETAKPGQQIPEGEEEEPVREEQTAEILTSETPTDIAARAYL